MLHECFLTLRYRVFGSVASENSLRRGRIRSCIERVFVDECVGHESPLLGQLRQRLGKRPVTFVFLATEHPEISDIKILDKLLDARSALLTTYWPQQDRRPALPFRHNIFRCEQVEQMPLGGKDFSVTRTDCGANVFRLGGFFRDDDLIGHDGSFKHRFGGGTRKRGWTPAS